MPELPTPRPDVTPDGAEFWAATAEGRLLVKRCAACDGAYFYPRPICPFCGSTETAWLECSGEGTIYSFTITRRGQGRYRGAEPYVLAYVELAEGPRIMTNIVTDDPEALTIGQPVRVVFDPVEPEDDQPDVALYRFEPR